MTATKEGPTTKADGQEFWDVSQPKTKTRQKRMVPKVTPGEHDGGAAIHSKKDVELNKLGKLEFKLRQQDANADEVLMEIWQSGLWKLRNHTTFELYVEKELGFTRVWAVQRIKAARCRKIAAEVAERLKCAVPVLTAGACQKLPDIKNEAAVEAVLEHAMKELPLKSYSGKQLRQFWAETPGIKKPKQSHKTKSMLTRGEDLVKEIAELIAKMTVSDSEKIMAQMEEVIADRRLAVQAA